ncbi:MAG: sugar-binding protein [Kiritimatiellia bacterium]
MIKHKFVLALTVLFLAAVGISAPPRTEAPVISAPPVMDGNLDDAVWNDAAALGSFTVMRSDQTVADTRVRIVRDAQWLYIALECDNPHMRFLNQLGKTRDDPGVFKDDSVEIFFTRDGLNRYFHYVLNFAGVQAERRIIGSGRDFAWSYPWVSATARTDKGWTAEIAIPLEVVNGDKSGDVRLNILRNKVEVELDAAGAKNSESMAHSFWAPVEKGAHEPERFGVLVGLTDLTAKPPFLPQIAALKTGNLDVSGEQFKFNVDVDIEGRSPVAGQARLEVIEHRVDGEVKISEMIQDLPPRCEKTFTLTVPVADFAAKKLALRLADNQTGMMLDEQILAFEGNLIKQAYPELSFYSNETEFRVKAVLSLAEAALAGLSLSLRDADGNPIAATDKLGAETILSSPVSALQPGANKLNLVLKRDDGKILSSRELTITAVPPAAGVETKADHFRRVVLLNGKPFFPFGMYANSILTSDMATEKIARQVASVGMNTLIGGTRASFLGEAPGELLKNMIQIADRHGLYFGFWGDIHSVFNGMPADASLSDRQAFISDNYQKNFDAKIRSVGEAIRSEPNLLFWYGFDEPNLGDWQANLFAQKLYYQTVREADPRHVMFGLYARYIPPVPEAVKYFDLLGYDVYTYTEWGGQHADVCGAMAAQTAQLDERAAELRQPVWMVPMGTALDPVRVPRPLSGQEQLCQSYAAIIYGARGLLYFHYNSTYGKETWNALRELGAQISEFAPAVLNDPVTQDVTYAAGKFDVARWQCPPVPFRAFRHPDGRLIALAVNAKNCPVDANIEIAGLRAVRRMSGDKTGFDVANNSFVDKLQPFAVRAYTLELDETPGQPLAIKIADTPFQEQARKLVSNDDLIKQARVRKNLALNPSLEEQKIAGLPDFCVPYKVMESEEVGEKGSRWFLDDVNPKFGKVSLRMNRYPTTGELQFWRAGAFGAFARPRDPEAPHVFSFYARAADANAKLWVGTATKGKGQWNQKVFDITQEWQRYSMPAPMNNLPPYHALVSFLVQPVTGGDKDDIIWVDGFQLEEGETPTEFEE